MFQQKESAALTELAVLSGPIFEVQAQLRCRSEYRADPNRVSVAGQGRASASQHACTSPRVHRNRYPAGTHLEIIWILVNHHSHCPKQNETVSNFAVRNVQAAAESVRVRCTVYGTKDCFKSIGQGHKLLTGEFSML